MSISRTIVRSAVMTIVVVTIASLSIAALGAGTDVLGVQPLGPEPTLDEDIVEQEVQSQINEVRVNSSLIVLEHDRQLQQQSDAHTERMATNGVLSHQIGDSTAQDRLGKADCAYGSENIAQSWQYEDIRIREGETMDTATEKELAAALVATWMTSEGHRQNILNSEYRDTAVSVEIRDDNKVYATQMFCE